MPKSQEYQNLQSWLHQYGNAAVHWTVFADLNVTERASGALTDLHRLLRSGSDEELLEFFNRARLDMRSEPKTDMESSEDTPLALWATPTD